MQFLRRSVGTPPREPPQNRGSTDAVIKWVRDRALDHAVEKENNLKPLVYLKDLIKSEPSKSLPLSTIAENRESLCIPFRPMDFVRKYPSVFQEFLPGGVGIHPHVRLTPQVLELDAEEQLIYQSDAYQKQAADRLLRLLMLCRVNQVPLIIVDKLAWEMGLPRDYVHSLVPHFPDYFQVKRAKGSLPGSGVEVLELVCWIDDLAVSVMEKKAMKERSGYEKGMPIAFPLQYSRGFEMDKQVKKWISDWQKLPYISPYENALHLPPTSDESDRWAVAVMHELLHILAPKKTEKENVLLLGEFLGLRSRFKRALLQHAGIFYVSSKNRTHTVVLREAYKRDELSEKHSMMNLRYQYVHLMNTMKERRNEATQALGVTSQQKQTIGVSKKVEGAEEVSGRSGKQGEDQASNSASDSEAQYSCDKDYDDTDEEEEEDYEEEDDFEESQAVAHRGVASERGRTKRGASSKGAELSVTLTQEKSDGRYTRRSRENAAIKDHGKSEKHAELNFNGRSSTRSDFSRSRQHSTSRRSDFPRTGGKFSSRRSDFARSEGQSSSRTHFQRSGGQSPSRTSDFQKIGGQLSSRRSDLPRSGGRSSSPNQRTFTE